MQASTITAAIVRFSLTFSPSAGFYVAAILEGKKGLGL
jgi:hypothetical protein